MKKLTLITIMALSTTLSACGGGGSSNNISSNVNPLGVYTGNTSDNQEIFGMIDSKNQLWMFYSNNPDSGNDGVVIGSLNIEGDKVKTAGKYFNFIDQSSSNITVIGNVREGMTFNGTAKEGEHSLTFNTTFDQDAVSTEKATYELIKGSYTGNAEIVGKKGSTNFSIDSNGKVTSNDSNCKYTGSLKPFTSKKVNYYEVVINFPYSSNCLLSGTTVNGVGAYDEDNGGELFIITKTSDLSQVLVANNKKK